MVVLLATPPLVGSVQNIFAGFSQVTDIQIGGQKIEKVIYQGQIIWERPITTGSYIQNVNSANCPTARTRVVDKRDGATYWIRKIPGTKSGGGDLCWMETNLAYSGGGDNAYGDVMPAIPQGSTSADFIYTEARYFVPPDSNRTAGTTDPSTSTDGGVTNPQYGYLYNWCATMGRQSAACQGSMASQPDQSVNPGNGTMYNICPTNWRLPTSVDGGDFQNLITVLNGGSTTSPSGLFTNGLYMRSGGWDGSTFATLAPNGFYWSSTAKFGTNVDTAYNLNFSSTHVNHAGYVNKRYGFAVRCVL